ncbi:MAG: ChaN family lipoprotein [Bacteroidales bacterium]
MKNLLVMLLTILPAVCFAQDKPAYQLFDRQGNRVEYSQMVQQSLQSKVVLFGELHNNPIVHWLQLELTKDIYQAAPDYLALGAEMLEADNQLILSEYVSGVIPENNFLAEARLWNNHQTDYQPLVDFAKANNLPFIATNIPRRYAALVNRQGFEALEQLSPEARSYIAPLPIAYDSSLPGYKAMMQMEGMPAHVSQNLPKAQAVKDATMAHFILMNLNPEGIFLHFHGAYHSNNDEGIVWYLHQKDKELTILTISTVEQEQVETLEPDHAGLADIIIVTPSTMTKTY